MMMLMMIKNRYKLIKSMQTLLLTLPLIILLKGVDFYSCKFVGLMLFTMIHPQKIFLEIFKQFNTRING